MCAAMMRRSDMVCSASEHTLASTREVCNICVGDLEQYALPR